MIYDEETRKAFLEGDKTLSDKKERLQYELEKAIGEIREKIKKLSWDKSKIEDKISKLNNQLKVLQR